MNKAKETALTEAVKVMEFEKGNVRKLADQLVSTLVKLEMGKNPHKLAWAIAKEVGDEFGADFKAKEVMKVIKSHSRELGEKPEHGMKYYEDQGTKGGKMLSHEEHVKNGKLGGKSLTKID